jgi:hypothetical protein
MRWKMRSKLSLAAIFIALQANAAQVLDVLPDGEIEAFISSSELSRVKINNDRIRAIRANDGELEIVEDNALGEVYILPNVQKPINIFIATEKNHTYKLLLIPQKTPSEQIFINPKLAKKKVEDVLQAKLVTLMKVMLNELESSEFQKLVIDEQRYLLEFNPVQLLEYQGSGLLGQVYELPYSFDLQSWLKGRAVKAHVINDKKLYVIMEDKNV